MEEGPKHMLFFDETNQKFVLHLGSYLDCPKDLGLPVTNSDDYSELYLIANYFERIIDNGVKLSHSDIRKILWSEAEKWVRGFGLPIEQWDGTFK